MKAVTEADAAGLAAEWRTRANLAPPEAAHAFRLCADGLEGAMTEVTEGAVEATVTGVFVNRESGAVVRVTSVDEHHAQVEALDGSSRYAMPRGEYNEKFGVWFRPAHMSDLAPLVDPAKFEAPTEVPDDWDARQRIGSEF